MSSELFDRYINGICTQQEKQQVEDWLKREEHAEELDALMAVRWQNSHDRMPEEEARILWQALQRKVGSRGTRKVINMHWYRAIAAAAVIVVVVSAAIRWQQYTRHNQSMAQHTDTLRLPGQQWLRVSNANNNPRSITLDDGSVVELASHSVIEYIKGFEQARRTIVLTGAATFTVAQDKLRPLSVYSAHLVTTALGTCFSVTDSEKGGQVRLYEGKVAVRAKTTAVAERAILAPGEEYSFNNQQRKALITRFTVATPPAATGTAVTTAKAAEQDTLVFSNTPLLQVLKQLQQYYHTSLKYQPKELVAITFSGTISKSDSLQMVLQVIANMNNLKIHNTANGYRIGK